MKKIAIVGTGAWGTALAIHGAAAGEDQALGHRVVAEEGIKHLRGAHHVHVRMPAGLGE